MWGSTRGGQEMVPFSSGGGVGGDSSGVGAWGALYPGGVVTEEVDRQGVNNGGQLVCT